jgi:hypothetical protein
MDSKYLRHARLEQFSVKQQDKYSVLGCVPAEEEKRCIEGIVKQFMSERKIKLSHLLYLS